LTSARGKNEEKDRMMERLVENLEKAEEGQYASKDSIKELLREINHMIASH